MMIDIYWYIGYLLSTSGIKAYHIVASIFRVFRLFFFLTYHYYHYYLYHQYHQYFYNYFYISVILSLLYLFYHLFIINIIITMSILRYLINTRSFTINSNFQLYPIRINYTWNIDSILPRARFDFIWNKI